LKKFIFPLDRVLEWRRTQQRLEEVKLERLNADLGALDSRLRMLEAERRRALAELTGGLGELTETRAGAQHHVTGFDLAAVDRYRKSAAEQASRLAASRIELAGRLAAQVQELANRRRDVRLVERLREQRFQAWRAGFMQEIDRQAEETHIAKFNRAEAHGRLEANGPLDAYS